MLKTQRFSLLSLLLLLPWVVTACTVDTTSLAGAVAAEPTGTATIEVVSPEPSPTPLKPPAVVVTNSPPAVAVAAPATATPHPTVETAVGTTVVENDAEAGETAVSDAPDATPMPTFTPPTLPFTTAAEHFWLRRPVPDGGVVWTDKVYPYGGTRGGSLRPHHGVEFNVPGGTPMLAAASGTVVVAGNDSVEIYGPQTGFYGNLIVIELDSRYQGQPVYILYGHLSELLVNVGQQVQVGEVIALSGGTGVADGPHLHFEVRLGQNDYNSTRNPILWLYPFPDYGAVAGRITWPDGSLAYEVPVSLRRLDGPSRYLATTSYAGGNVNPSELWDENFAIDDVPAGYYEITVRLGENRRITEEIWVFAYKTSFVEIVLEE
jgi:murein DD-endopeptidase MepM/ murein hydrolase activator NlpD